MNCVKFMRGTPAAFQKLPTKDINTFYMISDVNSNNCHLYIGNKHVDNEYVIYTKEEYQELDITKQVLSAGKMLIYKDGNTVKYKIGTGSNTINVLPWIGGTQDIIDIDSIIEAIANKLTDQQKNDFNSLFYCSFDNIDKLTFFNFRKDD